DWYDDALYYFAEWTMSAGRIVQLDGGAWQQEADFPKALELFRRFISEHRKGESRYYDQAVSQIENIIRPTIQFGLAWRNLKRIDLAIFKVDLTSDIRFNRDNSQGDWIQRINTVGRERVR